MALLLLLALVAVACEGTALDRQPAGTIPAMNAADAALLPTFADALPAMDPPTFGRLLGQLRGTPVLVNFWGSWCPPCEEEIPRIVAAHATFGERVQFLGVDILESREEARRFIVDLGITYPSVFDPPDAIKASLGQNGQPVTVFIERDGSVSTSWTGPISEERLAHNLRAIAS